MILAIGAKSLLVFDLWPAIATVVLVVVRRYWPIKFSLLGIGCVFLLWMDIVEETFASPYAFKGDVYRELGPSLFINDLISILVLLLFFVTDIGIRIFRHPARDEVARKIWVAYLRNN